MKSTETDPQYENQIVFAIDDDFRSFREFRQFFSGICCILGGSDRTVYFKIASKLDEGHWHNAFDYATGNSIYGDDLAIAKLGKDEFKDYYHLIQYFCPEKFNNSWWNQMKKACAFDVDERILLTGSMMNGGENMSVLRLSEFMKGRTLDFTRMHKMLDHDRLISHSVSVSWAFVWLDNIYDTKSVDAALLVTKYGFKMNGHEIVKYSFRDKRDGKSNTVTFSVMFDADMKNEYRKKVPCVPVLSVTLNNPDYNDCVREFLMVLRIMFDKKMDQELL